MILVDESGMLLSNALLRQGILLAMPCAGKHTCGKCVVWAKGGLDTPTETERALLARLPKASPPAAGFERRLACFATLCGVCEVIALESEMAVSLGVEQPLPRYDGGGADALGLAVDIGTTTLAMHLYDLSNGTLLARKGELSRQTAFGADVLSRIAHSDQHGMDGPVAALHEQLLTMADEMLAQTDRSIALLSRIVLTGNTTMLHFAAGLNPHGIGQHPFTPESLLGDAWPVGTLFPSLENDAEVYLPRCVGAYVGADVVCGMLAAGFERGGQCQLLVDVGTNGEMALAWNERILCCATAAGPAFEGAQIDMGMPAVSGAICRVYMENGVVRYDTIGDISARGICGTGLISAIRVMRDTEQMDETGAMEADEFVIGDSGVHITPGDVRALQLAKAAIAAGIDALLDAAGIRQEEVDALLLAGGFGSVLDPREAAAIGMIPAALVPRTRAAGNLALAGAARILFSQEARQAAECLADRAEEIPLATSPVFMRQYIERMLFVEE